MVIKITNTEMDEILYIPAWNIFYMRLVEEHEKPNYPKAYTVINLRCGHGSWNCFVSESIENITEQLGKFAEMLELFQKLQAIVHDNP